VSRDIDLLVTSAHLLTMTGTGVGYVSDGAMAIEGPRIVDVGSTSQLSERYRAREVIDATGYAVLPGLIDAHMHTRYAIVRGVAQDVSHWMQKGLAPFARHISTQAARAGTRLNVLEALMAGTTTLGDFLDPYPGWAECYVEAGVRARLTPTINAFPPAGMAGWKVGDVYPLDEERGRIAIDEAAAFCHRWHATHGGRITTMLGPQGPDMLSRAQLLAVKHIAKDTELMVHMHVAQGDREIEQMMQRCGQRSVAYLQDLGLLDDRLLAVHLTEASDAETRVIAGTGARMVLCSGSIGIIDGIVPPAQCFRAAGGLVALGSDQASGNNCNNMFNEMKLTALFNKIRFRNPEVMPAWEVLRMATVEGARAIGLGDTVGSLEAGKQADFIMVGLNAPNLAPVMETPLRTIVPNLVYAASGAEVDTVYVAGRCLMRGRRVLTLPASEILDEAQAQAASIARLVASDPLHRELALMAPMRDGRL